MKWKLSLLIALVIGALAGSWIKNLPGFVIIAYEKTTYEMRLWIAISLILLLLTSLALLGLLVRSLMRSAGKVKGWSGERGWRRSRKRTIEGMLAFTEGRWKASEDAMVNAARTSDTKLINYLIAAQAAQQQNAEVRRDSYLRLAHAAEPAASVAIGLTQAQLQLKHAQYEQALATLTELRAKNPSHPYVLKLLSQLFEKLQDWSQLLALVPSLKKQRVFPQQKVQTIEDDCVSGLLSNHAAQGDLEALKDRWLKLNSAQRKSAASIYHYAHLLVEFGEMDEAESLLRNLIKKQADAKILALYGQVKSNQLTKQLSFLEGWQNSHLDAPREVFLTLGKIAFNAKLWGKARHYLEQALQLKPSAEAYLTMAKTLEQLDDPSLMDNCYQQGLIFAAKSQSPNEPLALTSGNADLVSADLLPRFQKLEVKE